MTEPAKWRQDSFAMALEVALADVKYDIRHAAAVHALRGMAKYLDDNPQHVGRDVQKYMSMLAAMNLVPIQDRRPTRTEGEKSNEQQSAVPDGPAAALAGLRAEHGRPDLRVA